MKTLPLLICAALLCQTQGSDLTKPVEIYTTEGKTISQTCVDNDITQLAPPPGCINNSICEISREPKKYLSWSNGSVIIQTYNDSVSKGNYLIKYITGPLRGVLLMTISDISMKNTGLYRCGVITAAGRHIYTEYRIIVIGALKDRINVTKVVGAVGKNIKVEGHFKPLQIQKPNSICIQDYNKCQSFFVGTVVKNIKVEGHFKPLQIQKPNSICIQDYNKCQSFFEPFLYLKRDVRPEFILHTYQDNAENGKYSLKYGENSVTVGITGLTKADTGRYVCGVQAPSGENSSMMFEIFVEDVPEATSLLLLLLIPVLLLMAAGLWYLIFYKKRNSNLEEHRKKSDSQKADTSGEINAEVVVYENCPAPPSEPADSTYDSLSADSKDHAHIYSSIASQTPFR